VIRTAPQQIRPAPHLLHRYVGSRLVVAGLDEPPETGGAGDVGAFTDHHETGVGPDAERFQAAEAGARAVHRYRAWRERGDRLRDLADVRRARPAASTDHVDEARFGEPAQQPGRVVRLFVVAAERVGQARVRMTTGVRVRQA
jgi:hypothetical protein